MSELDRFIWGPGDLNVSGPLPTPPAPALPDVPFDLFPRPTGAELFAAKSKAEQDEMLGPEVAEAVRAGKVELEDLVRHAPMETEDDFITQASAQDLGLR